MSITFCPQINNTIIENDVAVNLSNSNAYRVQATLGLVPDNCGEIPAEELIMRCKNAYGSAVAAADVYLQGRFDSLIGLADSCLNNGVYTVGWA